MCLTEHMSYKECEGNIKNKTITVKFPAFQFILHASQNFECPYLPGKDSNLPISWRPIQENLLPQYVVSSLQQISKFTPNSPLDTMIEEETITTVPIPTIPTPE